MKPRKITKRMFLEMEKAFNAANSMKKEEDEVPSEWFTVKDYQTKFKISNGFAARQISSLVRKGLAEMKYFRVNLGVFVRRTAHYRMKP